MESGEIHEDRMDEARSERPSYVVLPGKYAYRRRVSDCEETLTFQTHDELMQYLQNRGQKSAEQASRVEPR